MEVDGGGFSTPPPVAQQHQLGSTTEEGPSASSDKTENVVADSTLTQQCTYQPFLSYSKLVIEAQCLCYQGTECNLLERCTVKYLFAYIKDGLEKIPGYMWDGPLSLTK